MLPISFCTVCNCRSTGREHPKPGAAPVPRVWQDLPTPAPEEAWAHLREDLHEEEETLRLTEAARRGHRPSRLPPEELPQETGRLLLHPRHQEEEAEHLEGEAPGAGQRH